jgi:cytochrome c-type biogenesis protein CcmH
MRNILLAIAVLSATTVWSAAPLDGFDDPKLNARYQAMIREVRCVQCQNTSIAGSSVELAADLRRQIHTMIAEGASDAEITEYLVTRYGDFIMYRPPLKPSTWVLWGGPVAMLAIGLLVFGRIAVSRARQPIADDDFDEPDDTEQRP